MLKKIVISPSNKGAISFFEEIAKRKAEIKKRLEEKAAKRLTAHKS
jgi:predicted transcriptional regulator